MLIRTPDELGLVIRDRRRKLKLNQTELAGRAKVGRQWLVELEKGKARAPFDLVLRTLAAPDLSLAVETAEPATSSGHEPAIDLDAIIAGTRRART